MKCKILTLFALLCLVVSGAWAQTQKSKGGGTKSSAPKTLYVEPEQRNYAQNLGGYMFFDYTYRESRGLLTECLLDKKEKKALVAQYSYSTFDEAFRNLPELPTAADLDTREKMAHYIDYEITPRMEAIENYEPEPELESEKDRYAKWRMDNAKRAAKGLPFDTIQPDPKWPEYNKVLDKIKAACTNDHKQFTDHIISFDVKDSDHFRWLDELHGGVPRFYYNAYAALMKQMIKEWFASEECKQVQKIEDELRARLAKTPNVKKAPSWFVEGRQREGEIVANYNRKLAERWLKKFPSSTMKTIKANLAKLIEYNKEIEAIRGDDPITETYITVRYSARSTITSAFHYYYYLMQLEGLPLVRTPDTQANAKKFKLEESPWKLSYPYQPRK